MMTVRLDYLYHENYNKLIGIDLSRQKIGVFLNELILLEHWKKVIDDVEDLDLVILKYNSLECSWKIILIRQVICGFIHNMTQIVLMLILRTLKLSK